MLVGNHRFRNPRSTRDFLGDKENRAGTAFPVSPLPRKLPERSKASRPGRAGDHFIGVIGENAQNFRAVDGGEVRARGAHGNFPFARRSACRSSSRTSGLRVSTGCLPQFLLVQGYCTGGAGGSDGRYCFAVHSSNSALSRRPRPPIPLLGEKWRFSPGRMTSSIMALVEAESCSGDVITLVRVTDGSEAGVEGGAGTSCIQAMNLGRYREAGAGFWAEC